MGKVTKVNKSRKEFKCNKCGSTIPKGSTYYRGSLNSSHDIIRCSKCKLKSWEVTASEYKLEVGRIVYDWRSHYDVDDDIISNISADLESIRDELSNKLDNMPEGLQDSGTGIMLQERVDSLDAALDQLDDVDVESIKDEIVDSLHSEEDAIVIKSAEDAYDFDEIYRDNPRLRDRMDDDFENMISSEIDDALEYILID